MHNLYDTTFYMNTNELQDFHIYMNVPLRLVITCVKR